MGSYKTTGSYKTMGSYKTRLSYKTMGSYKTEGESIENQMRIKGKPKENLSNPTKGFERGGSYKSLPFESY